MVRVLIDRTLSHLRQIGNGELTHALTQGLVNTSPHGKAMRIEFGPEQLQVQ